jgi:hypothetical protein
MRRNKAIPVYTVFAGNSEIPEEHERFMTFRAADEATAVQMAQVTWMMQHLEDGASSAEKITIHGYEIEIVHDSEFSESVWFSAKEGRHND